MGRGGGSQSEPPEWGDGTSPHSGERLRRSAAPPPSTGILFDCVTDLVKCF